MTVAILLLLACVVLAAAVGALAVVLVSLRRRVEQLAGQVAERGVGEAVLSPGLVTGASAPSSTSGGGGAPSSTSGGGGAPSSTSGAEYVITRLGDRPAESTEPVPTVEGRLFADLLLRESVVKAASFAYGVRRGLSPANRNRIWFEMRREVKRARRERRAEEREAVREWRARQRAAMRDTAREDDAA